ncbi:MAG: hypothetical protein K2H64_04240, partial [Desulfovibrio sp.]|nr:hypothetical protein [Desulfovibrio sp.]
NSARRDARLFLELDFSEMDLAGLRRPSLFYLDQVIGKGARGKKLERLALIRWSAGAWNNVIFRPSP